jgi:hypothetical protein
MHVSVKAQKRLGSNGCQFAPHHPPRKSDSRRSPVPTHTNFRPKQLKLRRDFLYDILTNVARKNRRIVSAYHWHPALLPLSTMATPNIHMGRLRDQTPNDRGQMRLAATGIAIVDTTTPLRRSGTQLAPHRFSKRKLHDWAKLVMWFKWIGSTPRPALDVDFVSLL